MKGPDRAGRAVVRLRVHRHMLLDEHGLREPVLTVFCPARGRSTSIVVCRRCASLHGAGDTIVECTPAEVERAATALAADPRRGADVRVGEVMSEHSASVPAHVLAPVVTQAFQHCAAAFVAIVVDLDERLVGLILRSEAEAAPAHRTAAELARPVVPIVDSATLATAVARMAKERARALPVVDEDGCIVGIITDLDALRRVAHPA